MKDIYLHKGYFNILTLYLILSVVNWLPIIDTSIIRLIKYVIFIYMFYYEVKHRGFLFPSLFLSPVWLFVILLSMMAGMFLSPNINSIVDVVLPFIIIWIFNFDKQFYYKAIFNATKVIALICVFSIVSYYTGIFNMEANGPWNSTFGEAAFGGYSTGYSDSLFLFVPFLTFWHRVKKRGVLSIELLIVVVIIIAQYTTGGRAGLIASILVFFFVFKISIVYKMLLIISITFMIQSESFLIQMRIKNVYGEEIDTDRISSGRISLGTYYYDKFFERPWFGYGFGKKENIDVNHDVHVVWLKNAINGGVIYTLLLVGIFIEFYIQVRNNRFFLQSEELVLFNSMFFIAFIITFLEPNYLIGSVQGEFVYWLLISLLLKKKTLKLEK